jgi:hypothetical protein
MALISFPGSESGFFSYSLHTGTFRIVLEMKTICEFARFGIVAVVLHCS